MHDPLADPAVTEDWESIPPSGGTGGTGYQYYDQPSNGDTRGQANYTSEPTPQPLPDASSVVIAVMGATGSGKTSFINTVSGSTLRVGQSLRSCTNVVQIATSFHLNGRNVVLIDTPGFDDTTKSDTEILRQIAAFLETSYKNNIRLAGVIYIHRISDFRMGGISTRNFRMFRELCGDTTLKNVVIMTNMWGEVDQAVGRAREKELATDPAFFQPVLAKGARMLRHDNTMASAERIIEYFLANKPLALQIQRELVDEKKDILHTAAGEELNRELLVQLRKHEKVMAELQQEMQDALRDKDEETQREIQAEANKLKAEMDRIRDDAAKLASNYEAEKERLEQNMREMMEQSRREQEENAANYQRQIQSLEQAIAHSAHRSSEERRALQEEIEQLRRRPPPRSGGFFSMIGGAIDRIFGMGR